MQHQAIFKRHELKYMLTKEQKAVISYAISPYMTLDKYGKTQIRNLYFDTDNYLLIRRSIEKPIYKEKLRLRCYGDLGDDGTVFAELKKKYKSVVYKRRVAMSEYQAVNWLINSGKPPLSSQITNEIDYFLSYYSALKPTVFLSYEREAYYSNDGSDFRITFDDNIQFRTDNLTLKSDRGCKPILPDDKVLMEIKCSGGIPMWMTKLLSSEHIYKTSFSKYGTAYKSIVQGEFS